MLKKRLFVLLILCSCGTPAGEFPPFIHVNVVDPTGIVAPLGETWEVTTSAIINGNFITNTNEVPNPANPLPSDLTISFSEQVRGQNVTVEIQGFAQGISVFSASGAAIAGSDSIEVIARFCGDTHIDEDRSEQCDDGPNNSDTLPNSCRTDCSNARCGDGVVDGGESCDDGDNNSDNTVDACRTTCQLPSCGDGVVDLLTGEECDDGGSTDADGCEANCLLPSCQNNILDPEDFLGNFCYFDNTPSPSPFIADARIKKISDIDSDGFEDIIFNDNSNIIIGFGDGQGSISETKIVRNIFPSVLVIDDFNNDGLPDILTANQTNTINIDINQGQRNFSQSLITLQDTVLSVTSGDFNNDNRTDIIATVGQNIFKVLGQQNGFATPVNLFFSINVAGAVLKSVDINKDNRQDFIILEGDLNANSKLTIAKGVGNGTFTFSSLDLPGITSIGGFFQNNISAITEGSETKIVLLDLDSPLLAKISHSDGVLLSNSTIELIPTLSNPRAIEVFDIDLDGIDDLIFSANNLEALLSSFNFEEKTISTLVSASDAIGVGDLDNDSIPDIVVGDKVLIFKE